MSESIYIVMPAYNEESNIESVVAEWYPILEYGDERSKMVISDGGSTDKTLEILYQLQKKYPRLEVLPRPGTDHGTKVILLYKYAMDHGADWIFQTDSDGQTVPEEFTGFWQLRKNYDLILGNRVERGDGIGRKLVELVLRLYIKIFFGVMVPDANAPFRLMRSSTVSKYIGLMPDNFNLPNAILAACFSRYKERVCYKPITFQPRQGGKNYMNLRRIIKIGWGSIFSFEEIRNKIKNIKRE